MTPSWATQDHEIWELWGDESQGYYLEGHSTKEAGSGVPFGWFYMELDSWFQVQEQLKALGFTEAEGHDANRRTMTT